MSTLRSALDELRLEDLRFLGDEDLASDLDELERASRVIEAERSRRLVEFERRDAFGTDGHLSASSWLAHRHRLPRTLAEAHLHLARMLEQVPAVAEALGSGEISTGAARSLGEAHRVAPEAFRSSEEALLEAARTLPFSELRRVVSYWKAAADPDQALREEDERFERRYLHVSPTLAGMVRVDGDLDPETGQHLITAIRAVMDAEARSGNGPDLRTAGQRRADALGEVCRTWLAMLDRPTVAGERPHVVVTVDLQTLNGRPGGLSELEDAGPVTAETARRIACDANVSRALTAGASEPLDVGRRTKVVPGSLRRAVSVRDRGCTFPGCERPPGWCDAHHVRHWADGGETALQNLVLLCRPHHRLIHRGFGVEMVDGRPRFTRPDGSELGERAPP